MIPWFVRIGLQATSVVCFLGWGRPSAQKHNKAQYMCNKRRATEPNNDIQHRHWLWCDWSEERKNNILFHSLLSIHSLGGDIKFTLWIHWSFKKNGLKRPPWKKLNHRLSLGSYQRALSQARPADLHKLSIIFTQIKIWCSFHIQYSQTRPHHWLKDYTAVLPDKVIT